MLGYGAFHVTLKHDEYARDRESITTQNNAERETRIANCLVRGSFDAAIQCIEEEIAADQEEKSSYKDLKAQQDMSIWALSMAIASFLALLLTAVGIFFVWRTVSLTRETLTATQRMAIDARKIGDMENRAWLACELKIPNGLLAARDSLPFGMELQITNIGRSLAVDVLADVFLFQEFSHHDEAEIEGLRLKLINRVETDYERAGLILPEETFRKARAEALKVDPCRVKPFLGGIMPCACIVAVYRTETDNDWHSTATLFDIYVRDADGVGLGHPFTMDGRAIPEEGLNVVKRRNAIAN
ncbi:hypothetical protein ACSSV4_000630 [Roseovarius sp. MBR-154]